MKEKIVYVDDNPVIPELVRDYLAQEGFCAYGFNWNGWSGVNQKPSTKTRLARLDAAGR